MTTTLTIVSLLRLPIALGILLAPGWLLTRRLGSGIPAVTAGLGSAAILFNLVLLLDTLRLPIEISTVGAGLALVAGVLFLTRTRRAGPNRPDLTPAGERSGWIWWCAAGLGLIAIATRATVDPLSGYDNLFRWDYLARFVLAKHSLAGYPPVSAGDFEWYSWCDGIPPLVSLLRFWIYGASGATAPVLTAALVVGEAVLVGLIVAALSRQWWGRSSARVALAVTASSAVLLWAIAMGQETGLTTLTFAALIYFLSADESPASPRNAFWAGLAAGVGAISREYGLAFILFGGAALLLRRTTRTATLLFTVTALAVGAPWYVRNWVLTGNPVYPQSLGGLFRGNAVFDELMRNISAQWGFATTEHHPRMIAILLVSLAGLPIALGLIGGIKLGKRGMLPLAGLALIVALWLWSLPLTDGGWTYSLRVLAPLLALCGALAGWISSLPRTARIGAAAIVGLFSADAARRVWLLPATPLVPPWPYVFSPWQDVRNAIQTYQAKPLWSQLAERAQDEAIVVDHPALHVLITLHGGRAIPLVSPILIDTLRPNASFDDTLHRLRTARIRFVILDPVGSVTRKFVAAHPFWRELDRRRPLRDDGDVRVFDLAHLEISAAHAANSDHSGNRFSE